LGVTICVGELAGAIKNSDDDDDELIEYIKILKEGFLAINKVLAKNNLLLHNEPLDIEIPKFRAEFDIPFEAIYRLKRFYAYFIKGKTIAPLEEEVNDDPVLESCWSPEYHLIYHSDCEGMYLPIAFDKALLDEQIHVPGGIIGSSVKLMQELKVIAPKLGITLQNDNISDDEIERIEQEWDENNFAYEQQAWVMFFEAARLSIELKSAIYLV